MKFFLVTCSVLSLPRNEPAHHGEILKADEFNDQGHIDRLLDKKHIREVEDPAIAEKAAKRAAKEGKSDTPAVPSAPGSSVPMLDLVQAAKDLGIGNPDKMTREALEAAIQAVGA